MAILLRPTTVDKMCPNRIRRSCIANDARCRAAGAPTPAGPRPRCSSEGTGRCVLAGSRRARSGTRKQLCGAISARSAGEMPRGRRPLQDPSGREGLVQGRQQDHRNKHECRNREKGVCGFGQHIREKKGLCHDRRLEFLSVMTGARYTWGGAVSLRGSNRYIFLLRHNWRRLCVDYASDERVFDAPRSRRANKNFQLHDMSACGGCPHSLDSPLRFTPGTPCGPGFRS